MAQRRNPARERKRCLEVLELTEEATDEQIKKSYRKLALQYHPDKNQSEDAKEKFQEIGYAYKYLTEGPEAVGLHDDSSDVGAFDDTATMDILFRLFPWLIGGGNQRRGHTTFMFSNGPGFGFSSFTSSPFHSSFFADHDDHFPTFMEEDSFGMRSPFDHLFHFQQPGLGGHFHRSSRSRHHQPQRNRPQRHHVNVNHRSTPKQEPQTNGGSRPFPTEDFIEISDDDDDDVIQGSTGPSRDTPMGNSSEEHRRDSDYFEKYRPDIPLSEKEEEEMLNIALELSKSELSKEDTNNNKKKEQESKKKKEDKNFSVKVSADYGADVPSGSGANEGQGQFNGMPRQGKPRDVDEFSTYDNCESDDNQDTMSWYDNIGGLTDNSLHSPMTEVHKTYYARKHHNHKDQPKAASSSVPHSTSKKSGPSHTAHTHGAGSRGTDHTDLGRRRANFRHGDDVRHHQTSSHVPKSSKTDKAKGTHHKH
ncbi:dnaJ homolog subfamily B member 6-like isoform X2 [Saccostrea cucullata]|uniref:dnaJ homolog subfamily B member 6-like isoform X2 n=1 Tax=Saccostrea cuccullata TaxID=36930 RepID=UPI002ED262CA